MTDLGDNEAKNTTIAHDDFVKPINEPEFYSESYQRPRYDEVFSLMPPFNFEGDDGDWKMHCLVEHMKRRRKADVKKENGSD